MEQKLKKGQKYPNWKEDCKKFPEYYKKRYPNYTEEDCKKAAQKFCRSVNYQCIEYYERKYPNLSHEEHLHMLNEKKHNKKYNNPLNLEYYKKHFPDKTEEEQKQLLYNFMSERNYQCIEYYKKHFPNKTEEEQESMLEEAIKKSIKKRPDSTGSNNPNYHTNVSLLERKIRSPKCIEFYEKRFPNLSHEEHLQMLNDHHKYVNSLRTPKNYITKIEYWLDKGYSKKEAEIKMKNFFKNYALTLDHFIKKYGEEEGKLRYEQRQTKWKHSLITHFLACGDKRSIQSDFANNMIKNICDKLNIKLPTSEKYIMDKQGNCYAFDFCYNHKFIEFNGDYWHCNPNIYGKDYINEVKKMTAAEIWEYDKNKMNVAKYYGYDVLYIWEQDYNNAIKNNTLDEILNKCLNFLND